MKETIIKIGETFNTKKNPAEKNYMACSEYVEYHDDDIAIMLDDILNTIERIEDFAEFCETCSDEVYEAICTAIDWYEELEEEDEQEEDDWYDQYIMKGTGVYFPHD